MPEENLIFGGQREEKDPRLGLKYFGPYHFSTETTTLEKINLGIIGNKSTIERIKEIIELIQRPIDSQEPNKWLYPPFPGVSKDNKFNCTLDISENWQETITQFEINKLMEISDVNERIGAAVNLYMNKIENIVSEDNPPHVIICGIPYPIEEYCGISEKTRGAKTPKLTSTEKKIRRYERENQKFLDEWGIEIIDEEEEKDKGFDLRNALKGKVMGLRFPVPVQLLKESTAKAIIDYDEYTIKKSQDPASFAWNFSTGLYYKANGKPWRLAKLRQDTCYVGISFYLDKLSYNEEIGTSMAQVFTHNGEGLVLRGDEVYKDENTGEFHLPEKQAQELLSSAIGMYKQRARRDPKRVVVHKSTLFAEEEKKGFSAAIGELMQDLVTLSKRNYGIRFMRPGSYPVLRGTLISLTDKEHLLYTFGYTPRIRTYPGHRIPSPLYITHEGDTEIIEICKEILGLTKLNWNTAAFATELPITLKFSKEVGKILSELDKNAPLQPHYRFFM